VKLNGTHKICIGVVAVAILLLNAALFAVPSSMTAPVLSYIQESMRGAVAWVKPAHAEEPRQEVARIVQMPDMNTSVFSSMGDAFSAQWAKITDATGLFWGSVQEKSTRIWDGIRSIPVSTGKRIAAIGGSIGEGITGFFSSIGDGAMAVVTSIENGVHGTFSAIGDVGHGIANFTGNVADGIADHMVKRSKLLWGWGKSGVQSIGDGIGDIFAAITDAGRFIGDLASVFSISASSVADISPAAGGDAGLLTIEEIEKSPVEIEEKKEAEKAQKYRFPLEERELRTDAVLVPVQKAVISSSRDGKIKQIYVHDGDRFKRGDVLLEYVCADVKGERQINEVQQNIAETRTEGSFRLMKLGLISDLEKLEMDAEQIQAKAQSEVLEARMDDCRIKAPFDGRVTNRLANPNEYTRTDRVLIEIADATSMNTEFVVPSRWLRWINVNAPLSVYLDDMAQEYKGEIIRIHGEVDPVSETVQVVARIDMQGDYLFPGMSGTVTLDAKEIRKQNIAGILEAKATQ